jgi:hypothetical protein
MFCASREQVLETIAKLGEQQCCYGGKPWAERTCDCKLGGPADSLTSEQTGCPELRTLHDLVTRLTPEQWAAQSMIGHVQQSASPTGG